MKQRHYILLVDDESEILEVLVDAVASLNMGYEVETATNAEDAIKIIRKREDHCALLVTDNRMPGMNGFDFIKAIIRDQLPVDRAVLGSGDQVFEKWQGLNIKVEDCLSVTFRKKPYDFDDFSNLVVEQLGFSELERDIE